VYLTQGLHRSVQSAPDAIATISGARIRTFAEHVERVSRLAAALQHLGVAPNDRVAILALNSDRYAEYLSAVPWADAVLAPINTRWSAQEVSYALNDSDTRILLVDDAFTAIAADACVTSPGVESVVHCGDGPTPPQMLNYEQLIAQHTPVGDPRRSGHKLAGLFYTGGTTGFPKGVMLSHTNLVTSALGAVASGNLVQQDSVLLHAAPMFHLADLSAWLGQCMLGGTHVFIPAFEPTSVFRAIETHRVTDVVLVPTMIQMLVDHPDVGGYDLGSLQRILYGGSPISEGVLNRTMSRFPDVALTQAYGMTELAAVATLLGPANHHGDRLRSAGAVAPHAEVRVIDAAGVELTPGHVGEICVRGGNVMRGYWNKPEETRAALIDGWMHTGDAGYFDDRGYLFVVDRIKDMIVTGGENVYAAEVENVLSRHPAVAAVAVIGIPSDKWGESVHACVVSTPGSAATAEELRDYVRGRIAAYKSPRTIDFVDGLPMSGAGKVLKRQLRELYH